MTTLIELPALPAPINELWHALLDLQERLTTPWSVVGGQMVLLHVPRARTRPAPDKPGRRRDLRTRTNATPSQGR